MYVKPSNKNYFRIKSLTMKVFSEEWARLNREVGMTTVVLKNAPNNFVTSIYIYIYCLAPALLNLVLTSKQGGSWGGGPAGPHPCLDALRRPHLETIPTHELGRWPDGRLDRLWRPALLHHGSSIAGRLRHGAEPQRYWRLHGHCRIQCDPV